MKKILFLSCFSLFTTCIFSQYSLQLIVNSVATKKQDDVFVAGNFNEWKPDSIAYKLKPLGSRKQITLENLSAGKYEFKFTRGSWEKVQTDAKGNDIENYAVDLHNDTTINISVEGWKDDFPVKPRRNTASAQVHILDTAFFIPQLNRYRRVWIYLPKDYQTNTKEYYPVLYMQDGQNLFNELTAPFGEWGIDECLDTLEPELHKDCIVVGIDNDPAHRITEYNPYDNDKYGKGEGKQYVDFLAQTLKPFIDKNYRTIKDASHTSVAGSSLGALVSLYAVMQYPRVFGKAGIFSPAFWIAPQFIDSLKCATFTTYPGFYFYAGGKESETMVSDMQKVEAQIKSKNYGNITQYISPLGEHNEVYWRKYFPGFFKWLMSN